MFNFFKRASKKDAKISATPQKHHNDRTLDKNKSVEILESYDTIHNGDAIDLEDYCSEDDNIGIMSPMAAFRSKGKNKRRNYQQKNKNVTNKTNLVKTDSNSAKSDELTNKKGANNQKSDTNLNLKLSESEIDVATSSSKCELQKSLSLNPNEFTKIQKHDKLQKNTSLNPIHLKNEPKQWKNNQEKHQRTESLVQDKNTNTKETTCASTHNKEYINDTIRGALKLQIDVPSVINYSKNNQKDVLHSGDTRSKVPEQNDTKVFSIKNENNLSKQTNNNEQLPINHNTKQNALDINVIQIKNLAPESSEGSTNVLVLPNETNSIVETNKMGNTSSENNREVENVSHIEIKENGYHEIEDNNSNLEVLNIEINGDVVDNKERQEFCDSKVDVVDVDKTINKEDINNEKPNYITENNNSNFNTYKEQKQNELIVIKDSDINSNQNSTQRTFENATQPQQEYKVLLLNGEVLVDTDNKDTISEGEDKIIDKMGFENSKNYEGDCATENNTCACKEVILKEERTNEGNTEQNDK